MARLQTVRQCECYIPLFFLWIFVCSFDYPPMLKPHSLIILLCEAWLLKLINLHVCSWVWVWAIPPPFGVQYSLWKWFSIIVDPGHWTLRCFRQQSLALGGGKVCLVLCAHCAQNKGCSKVVFVNTPETPWTHQLFGFKLIFGHCVFRNLLLLPMSFLGSSCSLGWCTV